MSVRSQAYFLEDHSEQIHRGILRGAIQHDAPQLPPLRLVKPLNFLQGQVNKFPQKKRKKKENKLTTVQHVIVIYEAEDPSHLLPIFIESATLTSLLYASATWLYAETCRCTRSY